MIERDLRTSVWNALRREGFPQPTCLRLIEAIVAECGSTRSSAAIAVILQADVEAPRFGLRYGLADCIDNDGHPYQSASLAAALQLLREGFPKQAGAPAAADAPNLNPAPLPGGAGVAAGSKSDSGTNPAGPGG